jgi:trans-aconitate 2-methyltransferase
MVNGIPDGNTGAAVREYYDQFRDSRMVRYRIDGNLRIQRAAERVVAYVRPESRVLEIGCGIGMVTEQVAGRLSSGHIWACDISPKNIEYATRTVRSRRIDFFTADALDGFDSIATKVSEPVDVVVMVDVLEHLPSKTHEGLFANLRAVMGSDAVAVLTYPSPQFQRYLREFEPDKLQLIDEVVELEHLLQVAGRTGLSLRHFSLEDVWRRNQYVHCVLQTTSSVALVERPRPAGVTRLVRRLRAVFDHRFLRPYRQRRFLARASPGNRQ